MVQSSAEVQSQYSQNGYLEFSIVSANVYEFVTYDAKFTMTIPANGP
jgi:outer membrane protein assembly factor BamA